MKIILATLLAGLILASCNIYPVYNEVTKEEVISPLIEKYGDIDNESVADIYDDGTERRIVIYFDYVITFTDEYGRPVTKHEVYYEIWNNRNPARSDWDYGWNILSGPHYL